MKGPNSRVCRNLSLRKLRCAVTVPSCVCREQFTIPQATPAFDDIVRQLPSEFVGPASSKTPLSAYFPPLAASTPFVSMQTRKGKSWVVSES